MKALVTNHLAVAKLLSRAVFWELREMYGVPSDLDLTRFYGASLDQICLGPFYLSFNFSNGMHIRVEGSWQLLDATGAVLDESDGPVGQVPGNQSRRNLRVRSLLVDKVESGEIDAPRSFTLRFASGCRLIIIADSELESFSIQPGDIFV